MISGKSKKTSLQAIFSKYGVYIVLVVIFIAGSLLSPSFLKIKNMTNVSRQIAVYCILGCGMTILLIAGVNDLSMGATLALAGYFGTAFYLRTDSLLLGILCAVVIGMFVGLINGFVVTKFRLPPFIATMSMDMIVRGFLYVYCGGIPIYKIGKMNTLSVTYVLDVIPLPLIFTLVIFIITAFILKKTILGRQIYAVGGNPEAARASGISITRTRILAFLVAGAFVGIAGCLQTARLNSALPNAAEGYHADAIAAAVLGGTAFGGGIGTAGGTLVGGVIIGFLNNILNLCGVDTYFQQIVRGAVIIAAVAYDIFSKNKKVRR